jgi:hypothetical protein
MSQVPIQPSQISTPTATFLGRTTAATGPVESLTAAQARTALAVNNVDNTADSAKPVSTAQAAAIALQIPLSQRGAANGVATLDAAGRVPIAQIPFEPITAVPALDLAISVSQTVFTKTISGASTFTFSGTIPAGQSCLVVLQLTVTGSSQTPSWPASVRWPAPGTAPAFAVGVHVISFVTFDAGTTWRASTAAYAT